MSARREIPEDFADHAEEPIRALSIRYEAGPTVIKRWRNALGVHVPPGAPRGNSNANRVGSDGKRILGEDDIRAIRTCLSCTAPRCTGRCWKVR